MKPEIDVIFQWIGFGDGCFRGWNSWCRLRIWRSQSIVLMSDLNEEGTGTSITNSVENIMTLIRRTYELTEPVIWIEHYPRHNAVAQLKQRIGAERAERKIQRDLMYQEEFSTVFCEWNGKRYREPKWQYFKSDNPLLRDIETDMNGCDRLPLVVAQVVVNRQVVER